MRKREDGEGRLFGLSGLELGMELCSALLSSVGRDGFHGGVRPDNIRMGGPKPELGPPLTHAAGEFTPQELEFMSPELFWSGERTPAADVYSVGLAMYAVYNGGRLPFWPETGEASPSERTSALQRRLRGEDIPPPPEAPQELGDVIMRSLTFRAEERWRDAEELRSALGDCSLSDSATKAAAAVITLAGSPLDKSSRELSEIEKMMAEIIEQGKPSFFPGPEAAAAPEAEPAPETAGVPKAEPASDAAGAPAAAPAPDVPAEGKPAADSAAPGGLEPAPHPEPVPVMTAAPETAPGMVPVSLHTTAAETTGTPAEPPPAAAPVSDSASKSAAAPRRGRGRSGIVVAIVCAAAVLLYFLLRSCGILTPAPKPAETAPGASPAGHEALAVSPSPAAPGVPSPTPRDGAEAPAMAYTPEPSPSPSLAPSAAPVPAEKYRVVAEDCTWEEARRRCEELGGRLAVARNREEFDALTAAAEEAGVYMLWIGARRQADGTWQWVTGETAEFFVWDTGQPSGQDFDGTAEDYLLLWKVKFGSGAWAFNDSRGDPVSAAPRYYRGKLGYICQFD